jgi:hypothetical protein
MAYTITTPRFWPWAIAFLITRAGDIWSTHLFMSQPGGEAGEMNPLTSILGFSFGPLVLSNLLVSAALIYGHWWYCRHYEPRIVPSAPNDRWQFLSLLYYGRPDDVRHILYRSGNTPKLYYAQLAHTLLKALAVASVFAVLHNLGQFHAWPINDSLREVLVRPAFVIYAIGFLAAVGFHVQLAGAEYKAWQTAQH